MTQLRKHTRRGRHSRQERALQQRNQELTRYCEGDYLDNRGRSLVRDSDSSKQNVKTSKKKKKVLAAKDIEQLEQKLGVSDASGS